MFQMTDPASPTMLDPPLCGVCSNTATLTCRTCNNIQYCSAKCQGTDAPLHITICASFASLQERPSPDHYRAIFVDAYEIRPKFIWLLVEGMRGSQNINKDDWSQYCSARRPSKIEINTHPAFFPPRQYSHRIHVDYDEEELHTNLRLVRLCGGKVEHFQGNYTARGYKYKVDTAPDQRDPCDAGISGGCEIAPDVDTTCLDPSVLWFQKYVDFEDEYCVFSSRRDLEIGLGWEMVGWRRMGVSARTCAVAWVQSQESISD